MLGGVTRAAPRSRYTVLERADVDTWRELGVVEADSQRQALRLVARARGEQTDGRELAAVPERSWRPRVVRAQLRIGV